MKKTLLAASALLALSVSTAFAADPVVEAMYDWTGSYSGLNAGYAFGSFQFHEVDGSSDSYNYDGFTGGLQAGYNWQSDSIVFGAETDIQIAGIDGSFDSEPGGWGCGGGPDNCNAETNWFGTARLRVGFAADNFLPYLTGGLAYGELDGEIEDAPSYFDLNDIALGWTAGGGVEWGIDENMSAKIEYLYVDLGDTPDKNDFQDFEVEAAFSLVRMGVNYRF